MTEHDHPIRVAIYARKSTAQSGANSDATSVALQVENARVFAAARGWIISEPHIYVDDAVSGAEVKKLRQREQLLATIRTGAAPAPDSADAGFGAVLAEGRRRSLYRTQTIAQAGIDVWTYQDGARFEYGTFSTNVNNYMRAEFNAEHRRQSAVITKAAHVRKVQAGHAVGGRTFGYENVRVNGHVERRILEPEAAIVRQVFDHYAAGWGYARIAKHLNATHAPCPRPQGGRPAGWGPTTLYEILRRSLYRGQIVWNKTRKRNLRGQTAPTRRPRPTGCTSTSRNCASSARRNGRQRTRGSVGPERDYRRQAGCVQQCGVMSTRNIY